MRKGILARVGLLALVATSGNMAISRVMPPVNCGQHLADVVDDNIEEFLAEPFRGFDRSDVPQRSFSIIALSNLADGLRNVAGSCPDLRNEVIEALDKVVRTAIDPRVNPYRIPLRDVTDLDGHGLYLSHLNIVLGNYETVARNDRFFDLNRRVSEHLAAVSLADPRRHFGSYPDRRFRWPADQAALLYSLHLFDINFETGISDEPIREWFDYMRDHATDRATGLPFSEVTGSLTGRIPRGCALSWTVKYIANFAPEEATRIWRRYRENFYDNLFFGGGFREWPRGTERRADVDSGPIVMGIGAAATAFGIGAARAIGDEDVYTGLKGSEFLANTYIRASGDESLERAADNFLASSIMFSSDTTPTLYNP